MGGGVEIKEKKGTVVVTGASGYVGSWLVMKLLRHGYQVRATVRDPTNLNKVKHLLDLQGSDEGLLSIWKADLNDGEGSFDEVISGCIGVFHVATPMDFESKDPEVTDRSLCRLFFQTSALLPQPASALLPHLALALLPQPASPLLPQSASLLLPRRRCPFVCRSSLPASPLLPQSASPLLPHPASVLHPQPTKNEVIRPTINGMLGILRSCRKAGTVRRVVFTSSAGTVNVERHQAPVYDESSWSDLDFIMRVKMTGWMYFVSKTLAEKAGWELAKEYGINLITIIPTLVVGSFITSGMPPSMITALSLITGNAAHYSILRQIQFVHLDDLVDAHIFLFEHPKANGRYICSSHDTTIYGLSKMLKKRYPTFPIPQEFEGIDPNIETVSFCSKKLTDLGFKYKHTLEEMFDDAIKTCREKQLIPLHSDPGPAHEKFSDSQKIIDAEGKYK